MRECQRLVGLGARSLRRVGFPGGPAVTVLEDARAQAEHLHVYRMDHIIGVFKIN